MGCTNWGLTYEKPSKSDWSMLAMTSWSGGVKTGCPRVKNLSKFSAPLPHCGEKRKERSVGVPPLTPGAALRGAGRGLRPVRRDGPWRVCGRAGAGHSDRSRGHSRLNRPAARNRNRKPGRGPACRGGASPAAPESPVSWVPPHSAPPFGAAGTDATRSGPRVSPPAGRPGSRGMRTVAPDLRGWGACRTFGSLQPCL